MSADSDDTDKQEPQVDWGAELDAGRAKCELGGYRDANGVFHITHVGLVPVKTPDAP